jgi:hypothetical protein
MGNAKTLEFFGGAAMAAFVKRNLWVGMLMLFALLVVADAFTH